MFSKRKRVVACVYDVRFALGSPVAMLPETDGWYSIIGFLDYEAATPL